MDWKLFRSIGGVVLIIIGFLALITPLTPGSWLIFVGAEILGIEFLSRDRVKKYYQQFKDWRNKKEETGSQD